MIRLLDRYMVRELVPPFLMGVSGFIVILIGDILYVLADYLARGQVGLGNLLRLLFYKMPHILVLTFPVSMLFASLLGVGRLAKDSEITALRMAGLSLTRIFAPILVFAFGVTMMSFGVNEYLTPWANQQADRLIRETVFREVFPNIKQNVFFRGPNDRYFYIREVDYTNRVLLGVMVYELGGDFPRLITARRATYGDGFWHLEDGVVRSFDADGYTNYEAGFRRFDIRVDPDEQGFFLQQKTPDQMSAAELQTHMAQLRHSGVDTQPIAVDYYFKFAAPMAALIFAFFAAPLALQATRGGRFTGVAAAIVLIFVYYVIMSTSRAWGRAGALHPFLAAWMANLVFLAAGVLLCLRAEGILTLRRPRGVGARRTQPAAV
ncbi:MAG: LptF/LptG family permease [Armatimonadota bacterium]|nr:LptF/LptG family permease [Armatimonadota bacterium]MDR5696925.1 LptF/LptG family permease [Armatimonadota bacterium]